LIDPPLFQLAGSFVIWVDEHLTVLVATVQALAVVVGDASSSKGEDLAFTVAFHPCVLAPQADRDAENTLIGDGHVASVFDSSALLDVDLGKSSH